LTAQVVTARLDVDVDEQAFLEGLLAPAERERAARLVSAVVRRRFIAARGRLRALLGERLSLAPRTITFSNGKFGKPSLHGLGAVPPLQFNISHSDEMAVYAFSDSLEVGIDVEAVLDIPESDDIAVRMFSAREVVAYRALPAEQKAVGFLNCWTRKEALVKALGAGLSYPLESFVVSLAPGDEPAILAMDETPGDRCGWRLSGLELPAGYVGALVVRDTTPAPAPQSGRRH
jgi:4'-phosphopantetheinyl transferase